MAANKFATMVHRNTNKITLILVYAMLEWVLIVLLLLNSLFSYLIIKFADYFGLKRPCLWCSRLDHLFEPAKFQNSYRSLVCEAHAMEISKLGYCLNHRKLAESQDMCEDCSSSPQAEFSNKFAFFPWMKKLGVVQECGSDKISESFEVISKCGCCGVSLEKKLCCPGNYLMKPSWGDSDDIHKGNFVLEADSDYNIDEGEDRSDKKTSGFVCDRCGEEQGVDKNWGVEERNCEEKTEEILSCSVSSFDCKEMVADESFKAETLMEKELESVEKDELNVSVDDPSCDQSGTIEEAGCKKDISSEIQQQHIEFYIDQDDCHLIPIELMVSSKQISDRNQKREKENRGNEDFVFEFDKNVGTLYELVEDRFNLDDKIPLLPILESEEEAMVAEMESSEFNENESSSELLADYELKVDLEEVAIAQPTQTPTSNGDAVIQEGSEIEGEEMESDKNQVSEEIHQTHSNEIEADISIGTENPDHEPVEDFQSQEVHINARDYHGSKQDEEDLVHVRTITVETSEPVTNNHLPLNSESNDTEEDKIPDTPTSVDSIHHLHKKLLFVERRESGIEESLDGSVISENEAGDGVLTAEKLKSALRAERKALNALYAELEEERSASAVAANQTMAMINRLQEEKAAMQMEALQYQRMMEEQSEYDQEALQLLNELMVKREKEKAELEKELEVYRKKVQDYETKEKLMILKRRKESSTRSGTSSASCSNAEDSDGVSVDLNHEAKEENGFENHQDTGNQNTPVDAVLYLEESLATFEEERLSILDQLKVLEEKLFTLSDEEEQHLEDIKPIEHLYEENGSCYNENLDHSSEANGVANGHYKEMNGNHHQERKNFGAKAKRLLPLFDAIDAETEDGIQNGHAEGLDSVALLKSINKFGVESKKLAIEEEVDHVYERLQALEADREFLKHCITSLKKGDKGIELLQEILHHLRDLRSVEHRVRNMGDGVL
ncbi:myosin-binding protein 2 [Manihot esculenta]|uniref:GTD-binding domain-containing protein n=2 Tax=Manihot esculenta TaxID=3983 RepID=A0A2C9U7R5_MANES|nr:myosin-binding protein 2 [Manihot esculenta]XP_021599521.1 myosin-binding protein 2 [Manihot esculenta]KAG8634765.1 hypothetical protein MANES_17G080700v8 [Manihot esculenta]OAY25270.1 hypothetical protein MANES_17G080700v8 [Manihot esculenta]